MRQITSFSGDHRFLSNFFESPVRFDGTIFASVEHGYQYAKTANTLEQTLIFTAPSPRQAKKLGREVTLRPDWEAIKIGVMRGLLVAKFPLNSNLGRRLLDTGDVGLFEGNTWGDDFWGVYNGRGQNWLGFLLMARRAELRGHALLSNEGDEL